MTYRERVLKATGVILSLDGEQKPASSNNPFTAEEDLPVKEWTDPSFGRDVVT
jgi:hypothetical protein